MNEFSGKTAVVTGGASGMGRAMALRFARAGMNVALGDVNEEGMAAVVAEAKALGVNAIGVRTDVSDEAANMALNAAACEAFGQVNVVCLNAGVTGSAGRSWTLTKDEWDWALGILLDGVVHGVRAFVPGMVEHGDGHVVMTASIAGHVSSAYSGPYMVAKHGVVALAETLYHELRAEKSDIGVTCLCPGFVNTDIVSATRRRPAGEMGSVTDELGGKWLDFSERALAGGLDPEVVGEQVYDAIVDNQFWLFTDKAWDEAITKKNQQLVARQSPTLGLPST
ncbi:MAG: NAD(P)-dependent dehydrogenase (short-subunit alcohol dehydrogenase family) [Acidimicrobiales bacterium]|jgi:NAD(P)-dependent dehydrogenase (short-subunit alcohol dehydrogenase family)